MLRKWTRRISIFLAALIVLIAGFILFLHTQWGRQMVRDKAESFLENKLQTKVSIGDVNYRLPNWIQLKKILILDQHHDTLLSGGNLYVRINMVELLSQDIEIGAIELEDVSLHLTRGKQDSAFNY